MTITDPTVDDLAELCAAMACDEACEIMEEIKTNDLTACEMVALLTILRPARERRTQAGGGSQVGALGLARPGCSALSGPPSRCHTAQPGFAAYQGYLGQRQPVSACGRIGSGHGHRGLSTRAGTGRR